MTHWSAADYRVEDGMLMQPEVHDADLTAITFDEHDDVLDVCIDVRLVSGARHRLTFRGVAELRGYELWKQNVVYELTVGRSSAGQYRGWSGEGTGVLPADDGPQAESASNERTNPGLFTVELVPANGVGIILSCRALEFEQRGNG